ncbi:MAG: hypothetical protein IKN55_12940, partial [Oscillospiraceae bacterium]|nr:hypothetical protein [Oscillospiraceae bacterium]
MALDYGLNGYRQQKSPCAGEDLWQYKSLRISGGHSGWGAGQSTAGVKGQRPLRQHRTKPAWRLGGTSACIFSVILHRNSLLGASPAASFLYNLTKNLT